MHDLEDRLAKVAVTPAGSVIAKRQKVATELKIYSNLMEEMLSITKESYGASLAAAQTDGPPCIRTHCNDYRPEIANR